MISSSGGEDYYRRKGIFGEKIPSCSSIFASHQGWAECCDYVAVACSSVSNEIFIERHVLRAGFTIEEIFNLTKVDRWFLVQIEEIVDFEEELASARN